MLLPKKTKYIIFYESFTGGVELFLGLGMLIFGKNIYLLYTYLRSLGFLTHSHNVLVMYVRGLLPFVVHYRIAIGILLICLGAVKIISSVAIYKKKEWGNDLLIVSLLILTPFDIIGIIRKITVIKIVYFLINIVIIVLLVPKRFKRLFHH